MSVLGIGLVQQDNELVAAGACQDVAAPQPLAPRRDEVPEDVVADVMAEGVVDFLEMVDVEDDDSPVRRSCRFDGQPARQLDVESPAIVGARERIRGAPAPRDRTPAGAGR